MHNIVSYYHIHLTDDPLIWSSIFLEQMKVIEDSGLKSQISKMNITAITQDDERVHMFAELCKTYDMNMSLVFIKNKFASDYEMLHSRETDESFTEQVTLSRIWNDCKEQNENVKIFYFHSKGSTSFATNMISGRIHKHKQYHYWRAFMNWAHLEKWAECVTALKYNDIVGGDFHSEPASHFCGNFWWANSDYIKQLPDPADKSWWYKLKETTTDEWIKRAPLRMSDEMWIGAREGVRAYDIVNLKGRNPVQECLVKFECERLLK